MPLIIAALVAAGSLLVGARLPAQSVFEGDPAQPLVEHVRSLPKPLQRGAAHAAGAAVQYYGTFAFDALHASDAIRDPRVLVVHEIRTRDYRREIARTRGIALGRTSDRLRDPANAAPRWAEPFVAAAAGRKGGEVAPVVVDLGEHVGVLLPVTTWGRCLACHDDGEALEPTVDRLLRLRYPSDPALGYAPGEHRGFVWAVAPK